MYDYLDNMTVIRSNCSFPLHIMHIRTGPLSHRIKTFLRFISWILCEPVNQNWTPTPNPTSGLTFAQHSFAFVAHVNKSFAGCGELTDSNAKHHAAPACANGFEVKARQPNESDDDSHLWEEAARRLDRFTRLVMAVLNIIILIFDVGIFMEEYI